MYVCVCVSWGGGGGGRSKTYRQIEKTIGISREQEGGSERDRKNQIQGKRGKNGTEWVSERKRIRY